MNPTTTVTNNTDNWFWKKELGQYERQSIVSLLR